MFSSLSSHLPSSTIHCWTRSTSFFSMYIGSSLFQTSLDLLIFSGHLTIMLVVFPYAFFHRMVSILELELSIVFPYIQRHDQHRSTFIQLCWPNVSHLHYLFTILECYTDHQTFHSSLRDPEFIIINLGSRNIFVGLRKFQ